MLIDAAKALIALILMGADNPQSVKPGESVVAYADNVTLMRGPEVVATLAKGQILTVDRVLGQWLNARVQVDDESTLGWVHSDQVLKAGDTVVVAPESAELKFGSEVLATLAKGQQFDVREILQNSSGIWLAALVYVDGVKKGGYVRMRDVVLANAAARKTTAEQKTALVENATKDASQNSEPSGPNSGENKQPEPSDTAAKQPQKGEASQTAGGQKSQDSREKTVREGVFVFVLPPALVKMPVAKLNRLKKEMLKTGRKLAASSKSAAPALFNGKSLAFFAGFQTRDGAFQITMTGQELPVAMERESMFELNSKRIEWGKKNGHLSEQSSGVRKIEVDGVPALLMDILSATERRLLTCTLFHPKYPKRCFAIAIEAEQGAYSDREDIVLDLFKTLRVDLGGK